MRKVLLATTALISVAFAGSAHAAAPSPISLNVGGYVDAVAGFYHEAQSTSATPRTSRDFETEYKISFDAMGKASNGMEYGANVGLWNGAEVGTLWNDAGTSANMNSAYVWMSGAFGKILFGDEHGSSDLFVYAPTVGEGEFDGRYRDFVSTRTLAYFQAAGIDNTEHSTKVTYYTPKVGNDKNKVQLGISYAPNMYNYGQNTDRTIATSAATGNVSPYQDIIKGALQYTGTFNPVNVVAALQVINGSANDSTNTLLTGTGKARNFTAWGLGTQAMINGWTAGASYVDNGSYNAVVGQGRSQNVWTLGGKYEFDKVGVALNYLQGKGYANYLQNTAGTTTNTYVNGFRALGAGAAYTWFPGLTSNADGVLFDQHDDLAAGDNRNQGYVFLVSQKLAF